MKTLRLIIIFQGVVILFMIAFIFRDTLFSQKEKQLRLEYEKIMDIPAIELTKDQWQIRNEFVLLEAKKTGITPDTFSYEEARRRAEYEIILNEMNNPCNETRMIEAFHEMMKFNMPYEKYNKEEIAVQKLSDCVLNINVTTSEPKYGWKTFWILQVSYDNNSNQYNMKKIKSDFLG